MKAIAYLLIFCGLASLWFFRDSDPLIKLGAASLLLLLWVKVAAFIWQIADGLKPKSKAGLLAYSLLWPGVVYKGFEKRGLPPSETGRNFLESWLLLISGSLLFLLAAYFGKGESVYFNYLALIALLMIIHMGLIEVLTDGLRLIGFSPKSLFHRPYCAHSLRNFWSQRWNLAFVDMNKLFISEPLRGRLPHGLTVFLIFLVSGVLHELAISYPANGQWGLPTLYFCFQGVGVLLEQRWRWPRWFVIAWVLLPLPVLFPPAFVNLFLGGLTSEVYEAIFSTAAKDMYSYAFLMGAFLHALVLCASVQVPKELGWREEFQRLRPLNRKVFWTYGSYIFAIIIFMAGVSVHLSDLSSFGVSELLWILFIALFWWARIGIDFLYMKHEDWPKGPHFTIGHVCLSTLFITLTLLYSVLALGVARSL